MNFNPRSYRVPVLRLTDVYQGDTVNGDPGTNDVLDTEQGKPSPQAQANTDASPQVPAPSAPPTPPIRTRTDFIPDEPVPQRGDAENDEYIPEPILDASKLTYTPTTTQGKNPDVTKPELVPPTPTSHPSVPVPPRKPQIPEPAGTYSGTTFEKTVSDAQTPGPLAVGTHPIPQLQQKKASAGQRGEQVKLVPSPWVISPSPDRPDTMGSVPSIQEPPPPPPPPPKPLTAPLKKPVDPFKQVVTQDVPDMWETASAPPPAPPKKEELDTTPAKEVRVEEKKVNAPEERETEVQRKINELLTRKQPESVPKENVSEKRIPQTQHAQALASVAQKLQNLRESAGLSPQNTKGVAVPSPTPASVPKVPQHGVFREDELVLPSIKEPQAPRAVPILRTFKNDMENVITHNKVSVVKIIADEEQKRHEPKARTEIRKTKKRHINVRLYAIVLGGLGVLAATVALGFFVAGLILEQQRKETTSEIFFSDTGREFDITGKDRTAILKGLTDLRDTIDLDLNETAEVRIIERVTTPGSEEEQRVLVTARKLLEALDTRASDFLRRTLYDSFIFGFYRDDLGKRNPFFIFKVRTYEIAFPGMLQWEVGLDADLAPLFGQALSRDLIERTAYESTAGQLGTGRDGTPVSPNNSSVGQVGIYDDVDIANQAVRALRGVDGDIQLLWTIVPGSNMLIITTTPDTFREVRKRTQS